MRAFKILPSAKFNPRLSYTTRNYTYSSEELGKMSLDEWANTFRKETIDVAKMDIGKATNRSCHHLSQVIILAICIIIPE